MRQKLIELSEILKQKPEIKERLERLEFGCYWVNMYTKPKVEMIISDIRWWNFYSLIDWFEVHFPHISQSVEIIWCAPSYSDILEYLGDDDYCLYHWQYQWWIWYLGNLLILNKPWTLAEQSDETLDEIISLCQKNVPRNNEATLWIRRIRRETT